MSKRYSGEALPGAVGVLILRELGYDKTVPREMR